MSLPKISVAFLSWNRLHYLRSTVLSARRCIDYPDVEWIISDNESTEPGLRAFVDGLDWVQEKWFKTQTHAAAMNEIVERAKGKYVLIWPEDIQFVVEGTWMRELVALLEKTEGIGSVVLNFLRRKTYRRLLGPVAMKDLAPILNEVRRRKTRFRSPRRLQGSGGVGLATFGWRLPGVIGSGIPSLTRVEHWQAMGPWRAGDPGRTSIIDSSLGAEDDMIRRFEDSGFALQQAILMKPVAADIITDAKGTKAKVRRGKRYGRYAGPTEGDFYYEILREADLPSNEEGYPLSFEGFVRPVGFSLPLDERGDLLKESLNLEIEEEISDGAVGDSALPLKAGHGSPSCP